MKTRLITFTLFLALIGIPLTSYAQGKIGIININAAIAGTAEGKKVIADLKKKYEPKQQELDRMQKEIQSIQAQLNKPPAGFSEEDQRRLTRDLEDKQKNLKRWTDDAQSDFAADRDETVRRLGQKMVRVITDYAQQNGFTLVMDGVQVPIYYASKGTEITEEIVKRYDAANPILDAGAPSKPVARPASSPATKPH
jgi:outer membrane protein